MDKLRLETSPDTDRLTGYLAAAQHAFIKGQLDVSLDAFVFEINDATVTDEDVVTAAYGGFNPIEHPRNALSKAWSLALTKRWLCPEKCGPLITRAFLAS